MTDRHAQSIKGAGRAPRRSIRARRLLVALHVALSLAFASLIAWQVARLLH